MERKIKTMFQLDSPFTKVEWPETSIEDQETILELLCSILSPIGNHQSHHINPSKGKRSKKRKRAEEKVKTESPKMSLPAPPEIASFVVVGLNSITRNLESLSKVANPEQQASAEDGGSAQASNIIPAANSNDPGACIKLLCQSRQKQYVSHFSAIFIPRSSQPAILHAHLPQLIAAASLVHPELPPTRLVQLPKGSEIRLSDALGVPRVNFIGILEGAPHSKSLIEVVRGCVPQVEIPWLKEVRSGYMPVKINAVEATVGSEKKEKKNEKS